MVDTIWGTCDRCGIRDDLYEVERPLGKFAISTTRQCELCRPHCAAIGCLEPLAEGNEADGCVLHECQAAIEDMNQSSLSFELHDRANRWLNRLYATIQIGKGGCDDKPRTLSIATR